MTADNTKKSVQHHTNPSLGGKDFRSNLQVNRNSFILEQSIDVEMHAS